MIEFGALVRSLRISRGFSQDELSALIGVSQRHLSFIETGRARPARDLVLKIASELELLYADVVRMLKLAGFGAGLPRPCSIHDVPDAFFQSAERLLVSNPVSPSIVMDDRLRIVRMNYAFATRLEVYDDFSDFMDGSYISFPLLILHPKGLATLNSMSSTDDFIVAFLQWVLRERLKNPEKLGPLVERLLRFPLCAASNGRIEPGGVFEGLLIEAATPFCTCRERIRILEIAPPLGYCGPAVPSLISWTVIPDDVETRRAYENVLREPRQQTNRHLLPFVVDEHQLFANIAAE